MGTLPFSAAILAGGDSKRMGENKAFVKLGDKALIDIIVGKLHPLFAEVLIVTDKAEALSYLPVRLVADIYKEGEKNTLRGIHAALSEALHPACFIVACDMPFISKGLIAYMAAFAMDYDLVAPRLEGYYQPLFAFYHKQALTVINEALEQKQYRVTALFQNQKLRVRNIDEETVSIYDPRQLSFLNINTREMLRCAEKYLNA